MDALSETTYEAAVQHALTFAGSAQSPDWFPLDDGESLHLVMPHVELIELRETALPLVGGQSSLELAVAQAIVTTAPSSRSIRTTELVPPREVGWLVVTDRRVEFVSQDRRRVWPFEGLVDLTHDISAPETWMVVTNHKVTAGLRYPRQSALEVRLAISLALADSRQARSALVRELRAQDPRAVSRGRKGLVAARNVWIGRPGRAVRWRIAQGTLTTLGSLVLLGSVLLQPPSTDHPVASSGEEQQQFAAPEPTTDVDAQAVADAAAARALARQRAHDQAVAAQKAARLAAARVAAQRAAAQLAAHRRAAQQAAAAQAAAEQAAADQAPADQAAAAGGGDNCTPEYPDFCIPQLPGDAYNCGDFSEKNFTALAPDPYRLDRDQDGIACES